MKYKHKRKLLYLVAIILAYVTVMATYNAFTQPAIVATPYLIIMAICGFLAYKIWPRKSGQIK